MKWFYAGRPREPHSISKETRGNATRKKIASALLGSALLIPVGLSPGHAETEPESITPKVSERVEAEENSTPDTSPAGDDAIESRALSIIPGVCEFVQQLDRPHISSSGGARAVQVHGNWANIDCSSNLAEVTVNLQRQNSLGIYTQVGRSGYSASLASAPVGDMPRGQRVTARYDCNGTTERTHRGWIDVDVIGVADPPNTTTTDGYTYACG